MKCTIESILGIKRKNGRIGTRIEGFISANTDIIPKHILKWMDNYDGVKVVIYDDGVGITSYVETECSPQDTFDELKGIRISEAKAKLRIYKFIRKFSEFMANYHASVSNYYQDAFMKYDHCVAHETKHFSTLSNE